MPTSIDPQPADDEIECARCGAHFSYELTRCPNCGVNLYEPEDEGNDEEPKKRRLSQGGLGARFEEFVRRLTKKPTPVDELFGAAINQAEAFTNLLGKVGGDRPTAERLVDFERQQSPKGNRMQWIESAIHRWERDNGVRGNK